MGASVQSERRAAERPDGEDISDLSGSRITDGSRARPA